MENTPKEADSANNVTDEPTFAQNAVTVSMSGAEMLKSWKEGGCFEVWAEQYKDIGPGKKFADSTEYVQATRARESYRGQ